MITFRKDVGEPIIQRCVKVDKVYEKDQGYI